MLRRISLLVGALVLSAVAPTAAVSTTAAASPDVVHLSEAHALTAGPVVTSTVGSAYSFSSVIASRPVRWNPCVTIRWQFRAPGAPAGGLAMARQVVARISQATGTRWVFDGTTSAAPSTAWLPTTTSNARPVLIG